MVWLLKWCVLSAGHLSCGCISCSWYAWVAGSLRGPYAWREVMLTAIAKKSDKVGFRSMRRHQSVACDTKVPHSCFADRCQTYEKAT